MSEPLSSSPQVLYLASNNAHKGEELKAMLGAAFDVRLARELVPDITWNETGETFLDNARIKAEALRLYTSASILADDSGLQVNALSGAPGVHSSRYAGEDGNDLANNTKLLGALRDVPTARRQARFVCVLYYINASGEAHSFRGECPGRIAEEPRGTGGFGYDPLFIVDATGGKSMAELTAAEKNELSHRRKAFDCFQRWLRASQHPA